MITGGIRMMWSLRLSAGWLAVVAGCCLLLAVPAWAGNVQDAVITLNQLRQQLGMQPLQLDSRLAQAAQAHADYLRLNRMSGHGERPGDMGFTGSTPPERAVAAGFPSRHVSENVHYSYGSAVSEDEAGSKAVKALMTAIYHRFGFLSFGIDRLGVASSRDGQQIVTVFVMGNAAEAALCEQPGFSGYGSYYYAVCADAGKKVDAALWEQSARQIAEKQPDWVVWPADGADDVTPVFANESPDPLPDMAVSGNPVSFSVNPARVDKVRMNRFELRDARGQLVAARLLDDRTDPNHKLKAEQFTLFPLQRLAWGQRYQVEIQADIGGQPVEIRQHFRTAHPALPMLTVRQQGTTLHVARNIHDFLLYVPPVADAPQVIESVSLSWRGIGALTHRIFDVNTVRVHMEQASARGEASVQLNSGYRFYLRTDR